MIQAPLVHYRAGTIFTADDTRPRAQSLVIAGEEVVFVGAADEADRLPGIARTVELDGRVILPGIVEAHSHLVNLGRSLDQVDLLNAPDLAEMQRRIAAAADDQPEAPRVLGRSWLFEPLAGEQPHRSMLDAVVPDRPVYLVSNDQHSGWVNSAALRELGIDRDTPDPEGGAIVRDEHGEATGLLLETAALVTMRGGIEALEDDAVRDRAVERALLSYRTAGVTAVADLGLRAAEVAALERAWGAGSLPIPVTGYLRIETSKDQAKIEAQLHRAIETQARIERKAQERGEADPRLRIAGVKLWIDGVIDSATAAMLEPFADGSHPEPLWRRDLLEPLVIAADAAGIQVAMHAIGDAAVDLALDAIAAARRANGASGIMHRLEHLEVVDTATPARLAELGVIASVQPVHCDPVVQGAWRRRLGDERVQRGYPWAELARPELPANHPEQRLDLDHALVAATRGAAEACGWGNRGVLRGGSRADFIVLDVDPFADSPEVLRTAMPAFTVVGGRESS